MRIGMSDIGRQKPVPADVYKLECVENREETFKSGAWGFVSRVTINGGEFDGRSIFNNLIVLDKDGGASKAFFRFKQQFEGLTGSDLEGVYCYDEDDGNWYDGLGDDANRVNESEVKDFFRDRASEMIGYASTAEVVINEQEDNPDRNEIRRWIG